MMQMNENEDDLKFQRPRSYSLPNLQYVDFDDQFDYDSANFKQNNYVFKQERNFEYEIQEYFILKK